MKIRLVQAGYEAYTGQVGLVAFTSGLSDEEVSAQTAAGVAAVVQITIEEGGQNDGIMDVTNPAVDVSDTEGDYDAAEAPAPTAEQ